MSLPVFWSDEAKETFDSTVLSIEVTWGENQAQIFVGHTQRIILLISEQPEMYKASFDRNVRKAVISRQTSMFYEIHDIFINILFFWDNRQNPIL